MSPTALAALTAVAVATSTQPQPKEPRWDVFRERMEAGTIFSPRSKPHPMPKDEKPCR
jgi:hypothetical protein